jgi:hypothetical protein
MAQRKPVIKSIEEATCETCIYGYYGESNVVICRQTVPVDTSSIIHSPETYWCGGGKWMLEQNDAGTWIEACKLYEVFNTFIVERVGNEITD